ncbi:type II toxin-antitoxin system VapB family antitoxin [Bradyrhizobium retamae]|uniref:type II toxin-antitoxin system VapB family antitoxin n=1 Tax=Bradyrhizobium retamae TaxID=1300035 RepID=UPI001FD8BF7C|nr:type II toxin-antitoxin system VapB family antitoxin [Bradyrhizobium retamae]
MRIEISIDDHLFASAQRFAGVADKSAVVRIALKAFVEREVRDGRLCSGRRSAATPPLLVALRG